MKITLTPALSFAIAASILFGGCSRPVPELSGSTATAPATSQATAISQTALITGTTPTASSTQTLTIAVPSATTPTQTPISSVTPTSTTASPSTTGKPTLTDFSQIGQPVLLASNFKFTEGPTWDHTRGVLLFSDIDANRIYQLALPNTITIFREPSNQSNGLTFDVNGYLLAAEYGSRSLTRTLADGTVVTLASNYLGKTLNSPNDLAVRSDGSIYFTDPTYGLGNRTKGVEFTGLYLLKPSGELVLEGKFDQSPNGVAMSPDQNTLYLALTTGNKILAFDVSKDGTTTHERTLAEMPQPDGMTVDVEGNIYAAVLDGIYIFSPAGNLLGKIKTSSQPTNCEFGGPKGNLLFITARDSLYYIEMPVSGF